MKITAKELQQIKGVGEVLAHRLLEAGHDSFAKIVKLGDVGLRKIKGMNPQAIPSILEQAATLAKNGASDRAARIKALQDSAEGLRSSVQELTASAKNRFAEKLAGKGGRKLTEGLIRFIAALEQVEGSAEQRLKRTGKGLIKAEQQLAGLAEVGFKELRKKLKKARKALQKVHS
jgi:Holliday junction resolvasome RuvABC DNA-binding subunit